MFKRGLVTPYELESSALERCVRLSIYLPKDYSAIQDYGVIIAFDGQDFSQLGQLHRQYERLTDSEEIRKAIIIFIHYPDVETRTRDYHPDSPHKERMIHFVMEELESFLTANFAITSDRVLMGDSLAASIALSISLKDKRFSRAVLFSPMITENIIKELNALDHDVRYYHVIGKEEDAFKLTTGEMADFLTPNRQFHQLLQAQNITHHYAELDGGHTWKCWKPEIAPSLLYFLKE